MNSVTRINIKTPNLWGYIRSGAIASILSTLVFAIVHHIFIEDIWFSFPVMAVAGATSGICISWTFGLLFQKFTLSTWLKFNLFFIAMFVLLGIISVIIFEPVTTITALREANERPTELINKSMPLTIIFNFAATIILGLLYGHNWKHYVSILLTNSILIFLLGLNVSILGLVIIPTESLYLILELFSLIFLIFFIYAVVFLALEKKRILIEKNK